MKPNPSIARLKQLLIYDKEAGLFFWGVSRGTKKKGSIAGSKNNYGYVVIGIDGWIYSAHRIAWAFEKGSMPNKFIDHINGDKADNRITNLREVSKQENCCNQRGSHNDNKTGFLGVTFIKKLSKYQAQIMVDGKQKYLGIYTNPKDAHQAYLVEKRNMHTSCTI